MKKILKKFATYGSDLSFGEQIIALIGIVLCFILLFKVSQYTEERFKNTAFSIVNNEANNLYNDMANDLSNIGYKINMIANDDNTYSISGIYEKNNVMSSILIQMDENGNIIQSNITSKANLNQLNISKYPNEKNTKEFLYYKIFDQTLNTLGFSITINDFEVLLNDAESYYGNIHGIYESDNNIYEIFRDDKYKYIILNNK